MQRTVMHPSTLLVAAVLAAGCTGSIVGIGGNDAEPIAGAAGSATGPGGGGSAGSGGGAKVGPTGSPINPSPLSRLTNTAYANTVRDLFPGIEVPVPALPADVSSGNFDNNAIAQTPSPALIEQYQLGAEAIAAAVMKQPAKLLTCQPTTPLDEQICGQQFLGDLARRAYRRPPTADEISRLDAFFTSSYQAYGFTTALSLAIQGVLQSPAFLYRTEVGSVGAGEKVELTTYELANRLSYFLWNTMPDAPLFAAAADGTLADPAVLEAQARRLLADPQAHVTVGRFHAQWLKFSKMDGLTKDPTLFPGFTPAVLDSMKKSAALFVERSFWDEGTLASLLTDQSAYVDEALAPIYGLSVPPGAPMTLAKLPDGQRSGILTQVGLLSAFARASEESPVFRGVFVLDRLLCAPPPPPPNNVSVTPPVANPGTPMTTRERFTKIHETGNCAGCHVSIDGVGFGFEHYDAIGRWRDTELAGPVDATGSLPLSSGKESFDGAVDLGQKLAASRQVAECATTKWLEFALGLDQSAVTDAMVSPLTDTLESHGGDVRELVIAIIKSDTFRFRSTPTP